MTNMKNKLNSNYYYALQIPADKLDPSGNPQYYFSNNLFGLFFKIIAHRLWHLRNGDGWKD